MDRKKFLPPRHMRKSFNRKPSRARRSAARHHGFFSTTLRRDKGFSLLEVLIGVSLFMVGLLGVTALQISSLKSNSFAGNLSEATMLASSRIEEIMTWDFDDARLTDKQADNETGHGWDGRDEIGALADDNDTDLGRNSMYTIYTNVSEEDPMPNCKQINVIIYWSIKGVGRRIAIPFTLMKKI